uniref:Uncharacterized protein n=1 Tax=Picocystis salinarum TaxID=88271 RepID=A0A7S3U8X2_9CHLO
MGIRGRGSTNESERAGSRLLVQLDADDLTGHIPEHHLDQLFLVLVGADPQLAVIFHAHARKQHVNMEMQTTYPIPGFHAIATTTCAFAQYPTSHGQYTSQSMRATASLELKQE